MQMFFFYSRDYIRKCLFFINISYVDKKCYSLEHTVCVLVTCDEYVSSSQHISKAVFCIVYVYGYLLALFSFSIFASFRAHYLQISGIS